MSWGKLDYKYYFFFFEYDITVKNSLYWIENGFLKWNNDSCT